MCERERQLTVHIRSDFIILGPDSLYVNSACAAAFHVFAWLRGREEVVPQLVPVCFTCSLPTYVNSFSLTFDIFTFDISETSVASFLGSDSSQLLVLS